MLPQSFESMLKLAGRLITGGLIVQLVSCFWLDVLSFVFFLTLGGLLTGAGTLIFLCWLVIGGPERAVSRDRRPV